MKSRTVCASVGTDDNKTTIRKIQGLRSKRPDSASVCIFQAVVSVHRCLVTRCMVWRTEELSIKGTF